MAIDSFVTPQDLEKQESRDRTLQDLYAVHNRSTFFKLDTIFNNDYIRPTVVLAFLFRLIFSGRLARIYAIFTNDELDNIGNDYSTRWRRTNIIGLHYVINVKEKKPGVKPQDQAENRVYVRKPQKNACTFSQTETLIVENLDWRLRSKNSVSELTSNDVEIGLDGKALEENNMHRWTKHFSESVNVLRIAYMPILRTEVGAQTFNYISFYCRQLAYLRLESSELYHSDSEETGQLFVYIPFLQIKCREHIIKSFILTITFHILVMVLSILFLSNWRMSISLYWTKVIKKSHLTQTGIMCAGAGQTEKPDF
ncbi:hypothetical protein J3Q64DRAFT_1701285 [Phycomyces blakesleeanus]|uniref:Uncharacterized protein n=1 Tax=Phycomyces blakesleeanus TaxID=4837 RepID=A0ABR3ATY9_PHYBL